MEDSRKTPTAVGCSDWAYREVLGVQHVMERAGDCRVSQPEALEKMLKEWKACNCKAKKRAI